MDGLLRVSRYIELVLNMDGFTQGIMIYRASSKHGWIPQGILIYRASSKHGWIPQSIMIYRASSKQG